MATSGESLATRGKFFIEDLTENDQIDDLKSYLSKFGVVKICNINQEGDSMPHGVAQYYELQSLDNLMQKKNRPHMLNGHSIYIYRELRGVPNFKIYRTYRNICTLSFGRKIPKNIRIEELNRHFSQYGTSIRINGKDMKITYDDYDSVDKAILANPHMFERISYNVEKYLSLSVSSESTDSLPHCQSEPELARKTKDSSRSHTGSLTIVTESPLENPSRIFGDAVNNIIKQVDSDFPNDIPSEWTPKSLRVGEAGGQGEVRIVYYRNNKERLAAIKIYKNAPKTKKHDKDLEDYYKERRMRAHRELTALKKLHGVANVSQVTSYSSDFTNIPDTAKDAVDGKILYWLIMEYINGCTLEDFVDKYKSIDLLNAIKLTQKLLRTVKQIHARGVVHRDIKPLNLLVSHDSRTPIEAAEIYVVDFGLAYIENREDDVNFSSFEEKPPYIQTFFGNAIGNRFFRVPQLDSASFKQLTAKQKNVLLDIRRSPTIDASSICAIFFWLITNIEPGLKNRDQSNHAPHENQYAEGRILEKIEQAINQSGIKQDLVDKLKVQLMDYLMSTFDRGFEFAERQWTIDQLEYRLESTLQLLQPKTISYDQQLNETIKNLFSFEIINQISNLSAIELEFHKISLAYEYGKKKFIEKHPLFSWYDGHCRWSQHLQDQIERKNHDILCYQNKKKNCMLIIVCSVHFDDNGDVFTLGIGSDFNCVYVDLPLRRCTPQQLDSLNIELEFERELINLLQTISISKTSN